MLFHLLAPFTAVYCLLLVTRVTIYDRYLLPLLVVALIVLLRFYQTKIYARPSMLSIAMVILFALFGIVAMHDTFVKYRARLSAVGELFDDGIARKDIRAGFEYDAWTELEMTGHVNDNRIRIPKAAYFPWSPPLPLTSPCRFFFEEETPSVSGRFLLTSELLPCARLSHFPEVSYRTWLPPHRHRILIEELSP